MSSWRFRHLFSSQTFNAAKLLNLGAGTRKFRRPRTKPLARQCRLFLKVRADLGGVIL